MRRTTAGSSRGPRGGLRRLLFPVGSRRSIPGRRGNTELSGPAPARAMRIRSPRTRRCRGRAPRRSVHPRVPRGAASRDIRPAVVPSHPRARGRRSRSIIVSNPVHPRRAPSGLRADRPHTARGGPSPGTGGPRGAGRPRPVLRFIPGRRGRFPLDFEAGSSPGAGVGPQGAGSVGHRLRFMPPEAASRGE